jgi:hypothetical protein
MGDSRNIPKVEVKHQSINQYISGGKQTFPQRL